MIQISTTAPANWPGAQTPLTAATRPVAAVTPVAPVASARAEDDPTRARRPASTEGVDGTDGARVDGAPPGRQAASDAADAALADAQALAEQRLADQQAREAREAADREAIERLRQVLVDTWDASAAVVEQALKEGEVAPGNSARAVSLYDEALQNPAASAGQIISRRV